jgi:polyhydroxyalkanoate synthesis regulator protein
MSNLEQLPILIKLYPNRRLYDGKWRAIAALMSCGPGGNGRCRS